MGFASGPVSFRRFFISGKWPGKPDTEIVESLATRAFGKGSAARPDGLEFGWITSEHLFDNDIAFEKVVFDRFLYFQMRIDKNTPPASIVRSYTRVEEEVALQASGREFLSKGERKAAREQAVMRAEKEAKAGMFRRTTAVPVLIDMAGRCIFFGNTGSAAGDAFVTLFRETFDAALLSGASDQVAWRIMEAGGDARSVEDAEPFHLVPDRRFEEDDFDHTDRTFFGREFLTWLWFRSEQNDAFRVAGDDLSLSLVKLLQLECDFRETGSDVVRCENPASAPESRAALPLGKQPTKAGLLIGGRDAEYAMILDGPKFNVSGLRLPDSEQSDRLAILEERFEHVVSAAGLLDMLFGLYLGRRCAADWLTELASIRQWALDTPPGLKLRLPEHAAAH